MGLLTHACHSEGIPANLCVPTAASSTVPTSFGAGCGISAVPTSLSAERGCTISTAASGAVPASLGAGSGFVVPAVASSAASALHGATMAPAAGSSAIPTLLDAGHCIIIPIVAFVGVLTVVIQGLAVVVLGLAIILVLFVVIAVIPVFFVVVISLLVPPISLLILLVVVGIVLFVVPTGFRVAVLAVAGRDWLGLASSSGPLNGRGGRMLKVAERAR